MKELGWIPTILHTMNLVAVLPAAERSYRHNKHDVHFAGFFPTSHGYLETSIGQGVMPAVKLAIRHVNRSPHVLPHHRIRMHWNNTACNPGVGLKSLFDMVHTEPRKVILFGDACSNVTGQIVKAARHWNLVQVTYADTHPMFTARSFPHFFRVVPSENQFNQPRLALLKQFNWTRVGTLYQNEARYSLAHNDLIMKLEENEFDVVASQSFNDELTNQLDIMIEKDVRIILGNFNQSWARVVFCDAYKKKVYGDKFQWLIVGMYQMHWWKAEDPSLDCTPDQILEALNGTLVVEVQTISSDWNATTVSGRTAGEYEQEYLEEAKKEAREYIRRQKGHHGRSSRDLTPKKHEEDSPYIYSRFHGYAYDGIWAIALAIQRVNDEARKDNQTMLNFRYKDENWERRFIKALNHTSFVGVTGAVQFKENSRRGTILINQVIEGNERCVGEYSGVTRTLHMERCHTISWTRVPKDRTVTKLLLTRVNLTVYTFLVVVASLGIVLGLGFLAVNIKYRHQKQIKMSSPNLNNLIIIGSVLCYTSVIILGLDSTLTSQAAFPYICAGKAWVLMAGFTLSFGSMFSKTWRVHSIFTNVQLNKKVMKDSQLFLVVGILLIIDIIIMSTWQVFDPFFRDTQDLRPYSPHGDVDVLIVPRNEHCKSTYMHIFVGIIYAYKGLLMVFGAFLAWETRNVQIPALNDSKYVGMSVYNVFIMCVLGVAISFVLNEDQNASFIIISVFIIFCTTGTLCLVFVPKIIELRRDPLGVSAQEKPHIRAGGNKVKVNTALQSLDDKLRIANKVKSKYLEVQDEKTLLLQSMYREVGEEANTIILNGSPKKSAESSASTGRSCAEILPKAQEQRNQPGIIHEPVRGWETAAETCSDGPQNISSSIETTVVGTVEREPCDTPDHCDNAAAPEPSSSSSSPHGSQPGNLTTPGPRVQHRRSVEHAVEETTSSRHRVSGGGKMRNNSIQTMAGRSVQHGDRRQHRRQSPIFAENANRVEKCRSEDFLPNHTCNHNNNYSYQVSSEENMDNLEHMQLYRRKSCPNRQKDGPKQPPFSPIGWQTPSPPGAPSWESTPPAPRGWGCTPPPPALEEWDSQSTCSCNSSTDPDGRCLNSSMEQQTHFSSLRKPHKSSRKYPELLHCSYSVGDELNCTTEETESYYRVDSTQGGEGTHEDQATQTDDEADLETERFIKPKRPTNLINGGVSWTQVRSQEELSTSCNRFNVHSQRYGPPDISKTKTTAKKLEKCAQPAAPIFQRLVEGRDPRHSKKLVSCPNIAVKCDIVEYL